MQVIFQGFLNTSLNSHSLSLSSVSCLGVYSRCGKGPFNSPFFSKLHAESCTACKDIRRKLFASMYDDDSPDTSSDSSSSDSWTAEQMHSHECESSGDSSNDPSEHAEEFTVEDAEDLDSTVEDAENSDSSDEQSRRSTSYAVADSQPPASSRNPARRLEGVTFTGHENPSPAWSTNYVKCEAKMLFEQQIRQVREDNRWHRPSSEVTRARSAFHQA